MRWRQIYVDSGLKWDAIHSRPRPDGQSLCSFRMGQTFQSFAYREGAWLRLLSLYPEHDSACH